MSTKKRNRFSRSSGAISVGQLRCIPESRQRSLHVMPNSSAQENPFFIWENTTFRLTKHCLLLAEGLWSCGSAPCLLTWKALKQTTPSLYSANSVLQQARDNYASWKVTNPAQITKKKTKACEFSSENQQHVPRSLLQAWEMTEGTPALAAKATRLLWDSRTPCLLLFSLLLLYLPPSQSRTPRLFTLGTIYILQSPAVPKIFYCFRTTWWD